MPKRKNRSFEDSFDAKRKKYDMSEQLQELMDSLRNYKTPQGKVLCETFIRAPKRRNLAEYYEVVSTPIDLLRIQQKIRMDEYDDLDQFTSDIELLVNNTKLYFKPDTAEHADAIKLWEVYLDLKNNYFGSSETTSVSDNSENESADESNMEVDEFELKELLNAVMSSHTDDNRQLSLMFEILPSKIDYPDYYDIVTEPIDLKTISQKIQNKEYSTLNDLEKDLLLMIRNAKLYNAPGSQIYKDANTLKRIIQQKRFDIELRRATPTKSSERIRAKRQTPFQNKWSSISLKYDEDGITCSSGIPEEFDDGTNDETNFSEHENEQNEFSNQQWLLFNAVHDTPHSEPFIKLPSKRYYPDYYAEINHPISLTMIGRKIKSKYYENISDLVDDLMLVFDNAMEYNRVDSKIYKDAAKLKKILQMKAKEIIAAFKDSADDDNIVNQDVNSSTKGTSTNSSRQNSTKRSMVNAMSQELKNVRRSQKASHNQQKTRMFAIYEHLENYFDGERYLIEPFIEKPKKKFYPDYYEVIENPIDMKTIQNKIKNGLYDSEESMIADFRLMFSNCRRYNEDNSIIYMDADRLEKELDQKIKDLGPLLTVEQHRSKKESTRPSSAIQMKIKTLYEAVRDYKDSNNRLLSTIFQKLPSRNEFPGYYEVITKPICLERIGLRVKNCVYETVEDLLSDIILMLDNACKYNEPDSQIFKDTLTLQQVALQTKIELNEDSVNGIPDVKIIVQDLLTKLFISFYNHQDEEGRYFIDSINELSEITEKNPDMPELKTLNFDIIKRNLNMGRYRRLDRFQQDMFEVLDRARRISRTDSQAFEDSIELQSYFITLRNDLCKNGEQLSSTALNFTIDNLNAHIETIRQEKVPKEINEEESNRTIEENDINTSSLSLAGSSNANMMGAFENDDEAVFYRDMMLKVGDFVYVEAQEKNLEPHIVYIEKFKRDSIGQILIYGCWFYRPHETFHLASRKFLEKEVFKSDNYTTTPLNQVIGKCCVMFVKDYFRLQPVNIEEKDVYVCESRYTSKVKTFKKIKIWPCIQNTALIMRTNMLPMNRVPSVFAKLEEENETPSTNDTSVLDVARPNVICPSPEGMEGTQFYEQFTIPAGTFRVGDCCYVRTDQERNLICRIDRMWVDSDGNPYFHGPWYVQQAELPPNTIGSFYPQEVFLSSIEDTNPLLSICERCCVLGLNDYCNQRPTEFVEKDIYVCEIRYLEHEKRFEPLPNGGLKKFSYQSFDVVRDEIYSFRKPLILSKSNYQLPQVLEDSQNIFQKMPDTLQPTGDPNSTVVRLDHDDSTNDTISGLSATLPQVTPIVSQNILQMPIVNDSSLTGTPVSCVTQIIPTSITNTSATPVGNSSKKKPSTKRLVTGYIIFASEVRRSVVEANPDCSFGDISRIIGNQWKLLSPDQKNDYEQRAAKQNQEVKEQAAAEKALQESMTPSSPAVHGPGQSVENGVFECHWMNICDFQFEDSQDLFDHLAAEPNGHVWISYADTKDKEHGEFQCMFHGCGRVKKGAAPFPSIQRLIRHCKEVHVNKQLAKIVDPEKRSRNYVPSSKTTNIQVTQAAIHPTGTIVTQTPQTQFPTINIQQPQLTLQPQVTSSTIPIMTAQGHPAIMTTQHPQTQIVTGPQGQTFIQHQIIQPAPIQGVIHQPTVVSSVPQSAIQIQTPQLQIHTTPQVQPQKTSIGVQVKPTDPIFLLPPKSNRLVHTEAYMKYIENLKPEKRFLSCWDRQLMASSSNLHRKNNELNPLSKWLGNGPLNHGDIENALWALRNFMFKDAMNLAQNC